MVGWAIPECEFTTIAVKTHKMNKVAASPQVTFSTKSVDLWLQNIWLAAEPPNVESIPPPLGFWIKITYHQ